MKVQQSDSHWGRLQGQQGTVMVETLVVIPFVLVFALGILEFGALFWERQLMQGGVRDAARYLSRCNPAFSSCSITVARNIAFYGNPTGTGALRLADWHRDDQLTVSAPFPPATTGSVTVTGSFTYQGSPLVSALRLPPILVSYASTQRYFGW